MGLSEALAVEMIQQDYRVLQRKVAGGSAGLPAGTLLEMRLTARDPPRPRNLTVTFERGVVRWLNFSTQDPVAALVAAGTILFGTRLRRRRRWLPEHLAGPLGAALLALGVAAMWFSLIPARDGQGLDKLPGFLGIGCALLLLLGGLGLMASSQSRAWARPARAVIQGTPDRAGLDGLRLC